MHARGCNLSLVCSVVRDTYVYRNIENRMDTENTGENHMGTTVAHPKGDDDMADAGVCIHVCMCMYTYVYVCLYVHMCVYIYICIYR